MTDASGRCLCGAVAYRVGRDPLRVTMCHCKFCQRATGGAYLVEPIFAKSDFSVTEGSPAVYDNRSSGSGKIVHVHFCPTCGTKLFMTFERFPDIVGVFGGSFDDPDWFERLPDNTRHIFLDSAQKGTVIPAGFPTFRQHVIDNEGTPLPPHVFTEPHVIG